MASTSVCAAVRPSTAGSVKSSRSSTFPRSSPRALVSKRVLPCPAHGPAARSAVSTRAASDNNSSNIVFGLDTAEGLFGFNPFAELWVGRLAMMGFLTSIVEEAITGQGTLEQIGFSTPSTPLLGAMLLVFGGATAAATAATISQYQDGSMSQPQVARIRKLLRLTSTEDDEVTSTAANLKLARDPVRMAFTDDTDSIAKARASATLADEFLADQTQEAAAVAVAMKDGPQIFQVEETRDADTQATIMKRPVGTSIALNAKADVMEQTLAASTELEYVKSVEMRNGRWAMLGFLAAIMVEAGTGHGIIMQLFDIAKLVGLLGPDSGF